MEIKQVLVTGGGGFIGSHLTEKCVELGYSVRSFVHYNSRNNWGWLEDSKFKNDIEIIPGDIREFNSVYQAMQGCDTVFHLAALIGIPYSYVSPLAYIRTNIEGTYNILECARLLQTENMLITSTSEIYGTAQYVPINEKHPMRAQSPYSATKIAADQLALSFFRSFQVPLKIVRPFNTYGPRQSARAIIPTIIIQMLEGKKVIRVGNVESTRDFTFINDTVNGFIEIAKYDDLVGEITNIGVNYEISIKDLVCLISELMQRKIKIEIENKRIRPNMSEVERLVCDNTKLTQHTSWCPQYTFENGLMETINWFKDNVQFYKPHIYNV